MLAKDMIAKMNQKYSHFKMRLGRAGDPELNSIAVTFFPESTQSKKGTPPAKPEENSEELAPLSDNHQDFQRERYGK